jgi:hypothetical protein
MSTFITYRSINTSQLAYELGQTFGGIHTLRVVGPEPNGKTLVDAPNTNQADLESAIASHVANPSWVHPNPPPLSDAELQDAEVPVQLTQLRNKARAVYAGTDTFTAAQSQKILAALVLRATR